MSDVKIICVDNGPFQVFGKFVLMDGKGEAYDLSGREALSLCRCGASADQPFCDGAHNESGFRSEEKARKLPAF
jgi:CDGSH-type Zn-finger protein